MTIVPDRASSVPDIRMDGVSYSQLQWHPPFCVRAPLAEDWRLYLIRSGEIWFAADDLNRTRHRLHPGAVIALSGVLHHRFQSPAEAFSPVPQTNWVEHPIGASPPGAAVITKGSIAKNRLPFLIPFERLVVITPEHHPDICRRIARAIDWIAEEARCPGPESNAIIRRLAELTTLEIGRFESRTDERREDGGREHGAVRVCADPRILRAIAAFYAAPAEKWSLERLAAIAGMSRTAFATRYRELIGTTPMRSLRHLRLQRAAEQLRQPRGTARVTTAARKAGYRSDTTFIRAFNHAFGITPGRSGR